MNLKYLRYFCAAYEARSTVGAARVCHLTQPAISGAIAQLEDELGVRLFVRQQRGLTPTPAAERLYRMAMRLLCDSEAIAASFRPESALPQLVLKVLPSLSIAHTRRLLSRLRSEVPGLQLQLVEGDEAADAALTAESCVDEGASFLALWEERYVLAVPHDHPLAVQEHISLADLQETPFIERSHCELSAAFHTALGNARIRPQVRARAGSEEWALGLVAAGIGLTILPMHAMAAAEGVVIRHDVADLRDYTRTIGLAYHAPATGSLTQVLAACGRWRAEGGRLLAAPAG